MALRRSVSLDEFARSIAPHLHILSISRPVPVMKRHNLVVLAESAEQLRDAVLDLEAVEPSDDKIGSVVMGDAHETELTGGQADPEGVGGMVLKRVVIGAAIGCVVGALVAGGVSLIVADLPAGVTAMLVGAFLGAAFGAIWTVFAGLGGSDAYRQSFVDENVTELTIASLHTDDVSHVAEALSKVPSSNGVIVLQVDARGRPANGVQMGDRSA